MTFITENNWRTSTVICRYAENPVLSAKDVPFPSLLIFNAGVVKYQGRYVMIFRNDYGSLQEKKLEGTNLGLAFSDDGLHWQVEPVPCFEWSDNDILWVNDPRLTVIDSRCYLSFAIIARSGVRGGIAVTDDFNSFEILHTTLPDNRNLALFPYKFSGKFFRLDRPFANYLREENNRFDIWISNSLDLIYWGNHKRLLSATDIPFCNEKIGPGPPPVLTKKGWLHVFHTVSIDPDRGKNGWEERWNKIYTAGIMLLDKDNPSKIIGFSKRPLIVPEEVKIYYGAADTVECVATANVDDLLHICLENN
jgi:beta-1,4-mannooligosaccharide/beta-1,4-mannosyl-N-acetylglucosamine phosphorylase